MKEKTWKIILGISTILSGLGNAVKIYETTGGINMKIDVAWLILAIIFISSITVLIYFNRKERKKDYKDFKQLTTENIRKLILKTESLSEESTMKWLTYHSQNYKCQEFDNLEEKINYLIDVKLHGDKPESSR